MDTAKNQIYFEKVTIKHQKIIFDWLAEPHMIEFWDNSQEHKDDILNFMHGRKKTSNYFNGIFTYWVGLINEEPFCFILTAEVEHDVNHPEIWLKNISTTGTTYSIDFGIGNPRFLGKKLAAPTLIAFTDYFKKNVDQNADTFFIDPDKSNPRAIHVYEQAGFQSVGEFMSDIGVFQGHGAYLMVKR